ncbi:MAG: hypothetical protein RIM99_04190 [Cyclobacteriaceae bacterium]
MKQTIGILSLILMIACSPDQKLIEENKQLRAEVEKQTELALNAAAEAQKAQAMAEAAAVEAQRQAAEAVRQRDLAMAATEKARDCR